MTAWPPARSSRYAGSGIVAQNSSQSSLALADGATERAERAGRGAATGTPALLRARRGTD